MVYSDLVVGVKTAWVKLKIKKDKRIIQPESLLQTGFLCFAGCEFVFI